MADTRGGSSLLKTEDWLAVWLGFLIIVLVLAGVRPDVPKFRWATDSGVAATAAGQKPAADKVGKEAHAQGAKGRAGAAGLRPRRPRETPAPLSARCSRATPAGMPSCGGRAISSSRPSASPSWAAASA